MRRHVPALLAILTVLLLAACGGGGDAGSGSPTSTGPSASEPAAAADGGSTEVAIESFTFMPEEVEVATGTEVTWTNGDDFAHTATSGTPDETTDRFDGVMGELGEMNGKGETFSFTFEEPGTYGYFCRFHPQQMRATVTVTG